MGFGFFGKLNDALTDQQNTAIARGERSEQVYTNPYVLAEIEAAAAPPPAPAQMARPEPVMNDLVRKLNQDRNVQIFGYMSWYWRPLRAVDVEFQPNANVTPYDKPVPIDMLRRVKTIADRFGNKVVFAVTDYAAVRPDPFLAVSPRGLVDQSRTLVIGVWDEPGFGT